MSGGGDRITVASLLAGEGAQVVKSEDGQVGGRGQRCKICIANDFFVAIICECVFNK